MGVMGMCWASYLLDMGWLWSGMLMGWSRLCIVWPGHGLYWAWSLLDMAWDMYGLGWAMHGLGIVCIVPCKGLAWAGNCLRMSSA
jgi:hypothetical protein